MVYLKSVENVITLGKLIGLLFLICLPLLSILFLKTKRNDLARPVMGTIFLVIFTRCRNAATGNNSMYCMIPDPFPSTAFGKVTGYTRLRMTRPPELTPGSFYTMTQG